MKTKPCAIIMLVIIYRHTQKYYTDDFYLFFISLTFVVYSNIVSYIIIITIIMLTRLRFSFVSLFFSIVNLTSKSHYFLFSRSHTVEQRCVSIIETLHVFLEIQLNHFSFDVKGARFRKLCIKQL